MFLSRKVLVRATERAVEYVDGRFSRVLEPGRHAVRRRAEHVRVGVLDRLTSLAPQEVPTADNLSVRVGVAVQWRVVDPRLFVETAENAFDVVYLAVQVALREALAGVGVEAVVRGGRAELAVALADAARVAGERVGIEVRAAVVKDVVVPVEVRAAYADLATAKVRGAAQLERARAETAALRSLANGARLLDEHPALARLRLVQALPAGAKVQILAPE